LAKRSDLSKNLGRDFAIDIGQAVIPAGMLKRQRGRLVPQPGKASCKADEKSPSQQREVARTKNLALKSRVLCGG